MTRARAFDYMTTDGMDMWLLQRHADATSTTTATNLIGDLKYEPEVPSPPLSSSSTPASLSSSTISSALLWRPINTYPFKMSRRASSLPNANLLSFPSSVKVRSQSESAALNKMNIKVPRNVYEFELCRQQWRCGSGKAPVCCASSPATFFTPQSDIQSDSEGDDSLVSSSEEGGCSSADGIDIAEEEHEDDEDLGVVRDLELYDRDIDTNNSYRFHQQLQQQNQSQQKQQPYLIATANNGATTPLVGSPSSPYATTFTSLASSTSATLASAMVAAAAAAADAPSPVPDIANLTSSALPNSSSPTVSTPSSASTITDNNLTPEALNAPLETSVRRLALLDDSENKKAVRFADECGKCLETIRVMTEPSDYPPLINPAVIRRFRKAASLAALATSAGDGSKLSSPASSPAMASALDDEDDDEEVLAALKAPRSSWKITFCQPASEYVKFRETLEHQKVALENVMLKNDVGRMVGTIKVSNIAFEKRVFIRFTSDGWKTYVDHPAVYQSSPSKAYDTFRFDVEIPRNTEKNARFEFCVCFEANGAGGDQIYWDSNGGKNFVLTGSDYDQFPSASAGQPIKSKSATPAVAFANGSRGGTEFAYGSPRIADAYCTDYDNWTKFASWRNLRTDAPYW